MAAVVHHVLLALALLAIGNASLRGASRVVPDGLDRLIVAIVFGAAAIVAEAILLGLVGLGGDTAALTIAAVVTWAVAQVTLPAPDLPPSSELARWWDGLGGGGRVVTAALAGAFGVWIAWLLRHPSIGFDASLYHYPEVAGWIANGKPGSILHVSYDIPHGNYPLTDEVALTWGAGIARSWVPLYLWNPALLVVLGLAAWSTFRHLEVPVRPARLATAGVVAWPMAIHQLSEPQNDLPMLTWMACTTALAAGSLKRPILLAPALVAAGLALGTKTTTLLVVLAALAVAFYANRANLRGLAPWLGVATGGFFLVGGLWYVRNLVQHGTPFWPFSPRGPWGDPGPRILELVDTTFLQRPIATLDGRIGVYSERVGGGWLILLGALLVLVGALLARRLPRRLRLQLALAGGFAVLCVVAFTTVPGTGLPTTPGLFEPYGWPISTLRYIQPAVFAATIAVALAARAGDRAEAAVSALLAASLVWTLIEDYRMGFPFVPSADTLILGAAGGVLAVAAVTGAMRLARPRLHVSPVPVVLGVALVAAVVLSQTSDGFISRHAQVEGTTALGPDLVAWFTTRPGFETGKWPVAFIGRSLQGPLAGPHFTHRLDLLAAHEPCKRVLAAARRGPVVVTDPGFLYKFIGVSSYDAQRCLASRRPAYRDVAFRVYLP